MENNYLDEARTKKFVDKLIDQTLSGDLKWDHALCQTLHAMLSFMQTAITIAPNERYIGVYLKSMGRTSIKIYPKEQDMQRLVAVVMESKKMPKDIEIWIENFLNPKPKECWLAKIFKTIRNEKSKTS